MTTYTKREWCGQVMTWQSLNHQSLETDQIYISHILLKQQYPYSQGFVFFFPWMRTNCNGHDLVGREREREREDDHLKPLITHHLESPITPPPDFCRASVASKHHHPPVLLRRGIGCCCCGVVDGEGIGGEWRRGRRVRGR